MTAFLLTNGAFLVGFVFLARTTVSPVAWTLFILAWFVVDYAVMYWANYEPPAWLWVGILVLVGALWVAAEMGLY